MNRPTLSVIILTKNRLSKLERCLAALIPQLGGRDEVILIDTGSTDGTVERYSTPEDSRIRLHRFDGPGSWAEARNLGIDRASGEFIAFLDDDCYPAADWVDRGCADLQNHDAAGGYVAPHAIADWPEWWHPDMGWLVGLSVPGHLGPEAGRYFYPFTANLWCRASVVKHERFQELGGHFSAEEKERYQLGREDAEWWRRIRIRGYRTHFDPHLRVEHDIDHSRLDFDYLLERARRDGEAWAAREGIGDDLDPLAYRYWQAIMGPPHEEGPRKPPTLADRKLQEFDRARQRAALDALAKKIAGSGLGASARGESATRIKNRALTGAAFRLMRDRARTIARRLALAASPPRPRPLPSDPPAEIGVAAFGFLGDMIILQSVLRGVISMQPEIRIRLLAPRSAEAVFRDFPNTELTMHPNGEIALEEAQQFISKWLGPTPPPVIVAPFLHGVWGPALIRSDQPRIPIVAFDRDQGLARQMDRDRIPHKVKKNLTEHEALNIARLFHATGLNCEPQPPKIEPKAEALEWAKEWIQKLPEKERGRPMVMINPMAREANRRWTADGWFTVMDALWRLYRAVNLVNGPRFDWSYYKVAPDEINVHFLSDLPLDRLIALLSLCAGIVTVDSGPQHLAHALGIPSVTLYGPMDERRWADLFHRSIHKTVRGGMFDLTPEELRGLPENHLMTLIRPIDIFHVIKEWPGIFPFSEAAEKIPGTNPH